MANQNEIENRIDTILAFKAEGHSYTVLVHFAEELWKVSNRHAKRYVSWAKQRESQLADAHSNQLLGSCLNQVDHLIAKAIQGDNLNLTQKLLGKKFQLVGLIQKGKMTKVGGKASEQVPTQPKLQPGDLESLMAALETEWEGPS